MSLSLGKKFPELLDQSLLLAVLTVGAGAAQIVVGEVRHDASLAFLLILAGVVLATLDRRRPLTVGTLSPVGL